MDKPDVDFIEGLSPAVSIDQKSTNRNPRSTVGTITEVYDYLRLLYARAGQPHCPNCGKPISRQTPQQIVDQVLAMEEGTRFQVLAPVVRARKGEYVDLFSSLQTQGFSRVRVDGVVHQLTDPPKLKKQEKHTIEVIVDRLTVKESAKRRLTDSVETALGLAGGLVVLDFVDLPEDDPQRERTFSEHLACVDDGCPSRRSSRGRSPSTRRSAPAPSAPASAPARRSTPTSSCRTPRRAWRRARSPRGRPR
jgi:Excinuclease ATPase subunit